MDHIQQLTSGHKYVQRGTNNVLQQALTNYTILLIEASEFGV